MRAACEHNDAAAAHRFLLQWAELRFPESAPHRLGVLADRLPAAAAAELAALEAHVYGVGGAQWSGQGLAAALKGIDSVTRPSDSDASEPLMPLYR